MHVTLYLDRFFTVIGDEFNAMKHCIELCMNILKVALYTKGSTIYEPTSQYDDYNIL